MPNTFELIASSTVGAGGASTITFSSIPSTYTDLVLRLSTRTSDSVGAANMTMSINGSSANQTNKYLFGNGTSASSGSGTNWDAGIQGSTFTSNTFTITDIYIPNYAGTTNKSASLEYATENNATTSSLVMEALLWSNTAAITSLSVAYSNIVQYSTAYLYGVKNA
jgi:hypothetical protein